MLAVTAGAATVAVLRGTTPALVGVGVALYLLALDAVEPLSQEIDHPDRTDGVPRPRGWLLVHLLAAPAVALIPFAVIGAVTVAAFEPDAAAFAAALCVPITLAGACGAVVSVVRDAPDPLSPPVASSAAVPPEFAGFTTTLRLLWPLAISTLAGLGVLAVREQPTAGTAVRIAVAAALIVVATAVWVRRRDEWRVRIRAFLVRGSSMTALALTGVAKSYGDAPVVGPLDLSVGTGERVVLLGHNGSGKTTLLRMAAGLLEPTAGSVDVGGSPAGSLPAQGGDVVPGRSTRVLRRPQCSRAPRVRRPAARRQRNGSINAATSCSPPSGWPTAPTTCR